MIPNKESRVGNRAAGYVRVSTKIQAEEGASLELQDNEVRKFAERKGLELVELFTEAGASAKTMNRPELIKLLKFCSDRKNQISHVIVHRIDRLSRMVGDAAQIMAGFHALGIRLHSVIEPIDATPVGRLMSNILASTAQFENEVRAEKSKDGMVQAVTKFGRFVWPSPVGYRNSKDEKLPSLLIDEPQAVFVRKAFEMVAHGYSERDVQTVLTKEEFRNKKGKPFARSTFGALLHNVVYIGRLKSFGGAKGDFIPLISEELFYAVQKALQSKRVNKRKVYIKHHPDFPLRGHVTCIDCGKRFSGSWSKGRKERHAYYRCGCSKHNLAKTALESVYAGILGRYNLAPDKTCAITLAIEAAFQKRQDMTLRRREDVESRLSKIKDMEGRIIEKNISGVVNDELAKEQLAKLAQEKDTLKGELGELSLLQGRMDDTVRRGLNILERLPESWANVKEIEKRKRLQSILFPEGVIYDNGELRTTKTALVLQQNTPLFSDVTCMVDPKLHSPNRLEWIGDRIGLIKIRNRQMKEVIERLPMPDRLVITL